LVLKKIDHEMMRNEIESKDTRLKYLETKRLTKEKAALIKKCQEERHLYKKRMDEYQGELVAAKQELSKLQQNNKENEHSTINESELSTLKIKNQILEKN